MRFHDRVCHKCKKKGHLCRSASAKSAMRDTAAPVFISMGTEQSSIIYTLMGGTLPLWPCRTVPTVYANRQSWSLIPHQLIEPVVNLLDWRSLMVLKPCTVNPEIFV